MAQVKNSYDEKLNALFVGFKPTGLSSNQYIGRLKRKFKQKKAGYSGTLDPFAKGVLICAFGAHTKLFRFLKKTPKSYRATLWLGAYSPTLDTERIEKIDDLEAFKEATIREVIHSLQGELTYLPPKFSAKKINGVRAYKLARSDAEFEMNAISSVIHDIKLIHYSHPFVTFEATVSEGTYIRSLGEIISQRLDLEPSALSYLERLNEGEFRYNNEVFLDPLDYLDLEKNIYTQDVETIILGQKLKREDFEIKELGTYYIDNGATFSIIEITEEKVSYILNKVEKC